LKCSLGGQWPLKRSLEKVPFKILGRVSYSHSIETINVCVSTRDGRFG